MAKKKKRDFWDDMDDEEVLIPARQSHADTAIDNDTAYVDDGKFHATRSMPFKIVTRLLLAVMAAVVIVSGIICYQYIDDRYDGEYTTNYFSSKGFSTQYNEAVTKVLKMIEAVDKDASLAQNEDTIHALIESTLGTSKNFSFIVQNDAMEQIFASGDDAKDRIESSNHFLQISTQDSNFVVNAGGVPAKGLNKSAWKNTMDGFGNLYIIYTAVDNNLNEGDAFYTSYLDYQKLTDYFHIARIAGAVALVLFIALLIFCVMSTGMTKGTDEVKLSLFDRIFTEIGAIISIAALIAIGCGTWYIHKNALWPDYAKYIIGLGIALFYIVLIRSYFSLVRRIKSGAFINNSLLYMLGSKINAGLNHLPKVVKGLIIFLFLIALNGGLVLGLIYLRDFTVKDFPIIFIIAPIIFIIELIVFISCLFGGVPAEDEYGDEEEEAAEEPSAEAQSQQDINPEDWEGVDFGSAVKGIDEAVIPPSEDAMGMTQENVMTPSADKTVMLSQEETRQIRERLGAMGEEPSQKTQMLDTEAVRAAEAAAAAKKAEQTAVHDDTLLDFIQLNKDVRKLFRLKLKEKAIGVTLRAPEKPIMLDIDKSNAIKVLSILFDNVEKYAKEGTRVYIEMYTQKGKMIYMMKNTIKDELLDTVTGEMGESLKSAKKIVSAEGGRFIVNVSDGIFKAGILLDAVE